MNIFRKVVGGVAVRILLLVVVAFVFPRGYRVGRTVVSKAKPEVVRPQVADLRAWKNRGAWPERDPGLKLSYSPVSTGEARGRQGRARRRGTAR